MSLEELDISRYIELKGKNLVSIEKDGENFIFFAARFDEITGSKKIIPVGRITIEKIGQFKQEISDNFNNYVLNLEELITDLNNLGPK